MKFKPSYLLIVPAIVDAVKAGRAAKRTKDIASAVKAANAVKEAADAVNKARKS
jgi:hypothetical protein